MKHFSGWLNTVHAQFITEQLELESDAAHQNYNNFLLIFQLIQLINPNQYLWGLRPFRSLSIPTIKSNVPIPYF